MSRRLSLRWGLSRTEIVLLVVFVAVGLSLFLPYIYQQRVMQRRLMCEERQTRTAQAILAWEEAEKRFPGYCNPLDNAGRQDREATSWVPPILSHLNASPERMVPELVCPDNRPPNPKTDVTWLAWVVNSGLPDVPNDVGLPPDWPANGVFLDMFGAPGNSEREGAALPDRHGGLQSVETSLAYVEAHDGAEHTLLLSENLDAGRYTETAEARVAFVWTPGLVNGQPDPGGVVLRINQERGNGDGSLRFARPSGNHRGGVNAVFCDSSNRFLNDHIDYLVFCRLMTCDDKGLKQAGTNDPLPPPYLVK